MSEESAEKKLVQLIRQIAKDVVYEALDEHVTDFEHAQKQVKPNE